MTRSGGPPVGTGGARGDEPRFGVGRAGATVGALAALLLVCLLAFIQLRAEESAEDELLDRFAERASFASAFVDTALVQAARSARADAKATLAGATAGDDELAELMREIAPDEPLALLFDARGRLLAAYPERPARQELARARRGARAALASGAFSPGVATVSGESGLEMAVRFETRHGPRVFVDVLDAATLEAFFDFFLANVPNAEGGQGYVVDAKGTVLGSSGPERTGQSLRDAALADAISGTARAGSFRAGEPHRFAAARVPRTGLRVVLTAPESALLGPADDAADLGWVLIALVTLLGGAGIALLIRYLDRQRRLATAQERLRDPLTGLANRAQLAAELESALAAGPVAVVAVGLDRFGRVNESFGAEVGDAVLIEVARRLAPKEHERFTLARTGGDEFAALAPGLEDLDEADALIERLQDRLRTPVAFGRQEMVIGATFGVALAPSGEERAELVIAAASAALGHAKRAGRPVGYASEDRREQSRRRVELESALRKALLDRAVDVHYQPIVTLPEGRVAAVEALARWEHPTFGPVSPGEFIPLAEEGGLIGALGDLVLATAAQQLAAWRELGHELRVHVNVSGRQLADRGLLFEVPAALATAGLPPEALVLEVTESAVLQDPRSAGEQLAELRAHGVSVSLDDFGVGFSSLKHLAELAPIDQVKIDRSFVSDLAVDRSAAIVGSVVAICRQLDLGCVAEGVETPEQLERLRELGVDCAQGFLFARPEPPELVERRLGVALPG